MEILFKRGLKQGDPLSLLLFLLVAERLNLLFRRIEDVDKMKGLLGGHKTTFINLQYTDDTMLFSQCNVIQACAIKWVLNCIETWLGMQINFYKSPLTLIGEQNFTSHFKLGIFGCLESRSPINCLRIPIRTNKLKRSDWEPVLEKINKRLEGGKAKLSPWE